MVFVNDKKFACESCIKGHRSSNCQHTDRPLFEIKKKGRPVSQCEKCRELRKTKRMHSKCTCSVAPASEAGPSSQGLAAKAADGADSSAPKPKTRRFKPIAPALPNGLKDLLPPTAQPSGTGEIKLCRCGGRDPSICTCGHDRALSLSASGASGLAALAQAAMFCCGNDTSSAPLRASVSSAPVVMTASVQSNAIVPEDEGSRKHPRGCCSGGLSSRPPSPTAKRSKLIPHPDASSSSVSKQSSLPAAFPEHPLPAVGAQPLQPLLETPSTARPSLFPPIPPISTIMSYAPPECCCGTNCACPGCLKHRGEAHASKDFEDCAEGSCGICVDHEGGVEMPEAAFAASQGGFAFSTRNVPNAGPRASSSRISGDGPGSGVKLITPTSTSTSTSFIDAFFARAAALPPPPPSRTRAGALDPMNVVVYPSDLFSGDAERRKERGAAFGLVEVPKLECHCPGGCGCPEGRCACGDSCTGCGPSVAVGRLEGGVSEVSANGGTGGAGEGERSSGDAKGCCG
ncbi:hypothetical protein BD414DRAFT_490242 [Trametes punicea]|nr:hypothetical protein BD414DRAFT_490242 [Trametes punicea]